MIEGNSWTLLCYARVALLKSLTNQYLSTFMQQLMSLMKGRNEAFSLCAYYYNILKKNRCLISPSLCGHGKAGRNENKPKL